MKRMVALTLSVLMILSFAGCGKEPQPSATVSTTAPTTVATEPTTIPTTAPTEPTTVPTEPPGKFDPEACAALFASWTFTVTLDESLMALPEFEGSASFPVTWSFDSDGTYTTMADSAEAITAFETLLIDYMVDSRFRIFKAECDLKGKYDAYIQKEWNEGGLGEQTRQEATQTVADLDLTGRYAQLEREGEYYVGDGILYLDEDAYPFTLEDGKLTLTDGPEEILTYPLILDQTVEG